MKNFSSHSLFQIQPQDPNKGSETSQQQEGKPIQEQDFEEEEEEERARCEWNFSLSTIVSSSTTSGAVCDTLGVVEFDQSDRLLATGGIARKIRVYSLNSLLPNEDSLALLDHSNACDHCICTPAKLSSLRWKPGCGGGVLGSGDYDGVVMEYDLEKGVPIFERDEHGGRRVWSMDYSHRDPILGGSGSDDGMVHLWDPRCDGGRCLAKAQPSPTRSSVCCVEFDPFDGSLVVAGCSDSKIYGYDVRNMVNPMLILDGHKKPVTYVKFLDHETIITSGIDGCLKMWCTKNCCPIRTYKGHINTRRFVGLSVWRNGGLLCCGSESNQVFVYDKRWSEPIWVQGFDPVGQVGCDPSFVSSVCLRQVGEDCCILAAGDSDGVLQVYKGRRKPL